ncbi:SRPBCC family protein [Streptomyces albireticuli]|uniref:SRPBCC family protein n=1 Tax=Streptomyces albireticuli TaxID=1940 RepID=UPI0036849AC9
MTVEPRTSRTGRHHYRFRSEWDLAVAPAAVYACLGAPDDYPAWWPQIRQVTRTGTGPDAPDTGTARIRSFLPYELTVTVRAGRRDPEARVLEVTLTGDVEGWARWTVLPRHPTGTHLRYEQAVEAHRPLLRLLALPARPLLRANHTWMMRGARRGLRARLAPHEEGI